MIAIANWPLVPVLLLVVWLAGLVAVAVIEGRGR